MAPRNLRKRKEESDDDEAEEAAAAGGQGDTALQERIEDARTLIKNRVKSKGVGAGALALGAAKVSADEAAVDVNAGMGKMGGSFAIGAAVDADGEDPNMLKFIENELAKRRNAGAALDEDEDGEGAVVERTEEEMLWDTPDDLKVRKVEGEETADRWLTGIVEVQLPMDFKLRNIEETEIAKQKMLEKTRGRMGAGSGHGMGGYRASDEQDPSHRPVSVPLPKKVPQPANLSANFTLHRKMFAKSFGQGRGSTTTMQEFVGAPKTQKAENVASDDYVFKRWVNNEKKKKQRH